MRVVCLTSNRYVHCLGAFAYCLDKHWPGQAVDVVGYEDLPHVELVDAFNLVTIGNQADYTWSGGLMAYLESIKDELVLLLLDDYWLTGPVDRETIRILERGFYAFDDMAKADLSGDRMLFAHDRGFGRLRNGVELIRARTDRALYDPAGGVKARLFLFSFQAAIWRRSYLLGNLRATEDAWQAEERGTRRLLDSTGIIVGTVPRAFPYPESPPRPPLVYANATKAGKPDLLRADKIPGPLLGELQAGGHLTHWGYAQSG